jgi:catalase
METPFNKNKFIKGRKIAVLLEDGYNFNEVRELKEFMLKEGATVDIISKLYGSRKSSDGREVAVDITHTTARSVKYDGVFIPSGDNDNVSQMKNSEAVILFILETFKHCKPMGAVGNAVALFDRLKKIDISIANSSTGNEVKSDMGVVTLTDTTDMVEYLEEFKQAMVQHRFWKREEINTVLY